MFRFRVRKIQVHYLNLHKGRTFSRYIYLFRIENRALSFILNLLFLLEVSFSFYHVFFADVFPAEFLDDG